MAPSFFRRSTPMVPPASPEVARALNQLDQLAKERPSLSSAISVLQDVIPAAFGERNGESAVLSVEGPAAQQPGVPLFRGRLLRWDRQELGRRWRTVCAMVARQRADDAGARLLRAVEAKLVAPDELLKQVLDGDASTIHRAAKQQGIDAGLMAVVFRLTFLPILASHRAAISRRVESGESAGSAGEQGYCPVCGCGPALGELRGLEQSLFLRCGLCAGDWPFPRVRCPFCGTDDHQALGFLSIEGEEDRRRAATCDACRRYLKLVGTLAPLSTPELLVADVSTLHLDLAAAEQGYVNS